MFVLSTARSALALAAAVVGGILTPTVLAQTTLFPLAGARAISVNGGRIYFNDPTIEICTAQRSLSASVAGGSISTLLTVPGCPLAGLIEADGSYVFTVSGSSIVRLWSGGLNDSPTTLTTPAGTVGKIDVTPDWVYWQTTSAVGRVGRDGTNPTQIVRATTSQLGLAAASNGFVYWSEGGAGAGVIKRADLSAPSPSIVAGGTFNAPGNLATDTTHVYWSETDGVIKRAPLGGGAATTLRSAVAGGYVVVGVEVDSTHVYWLESTSVGQGRFFRVPLGGGAATQVGPGTLSIPRSMQLASDFLYWVENSTGDIRRMPKDAAAVLPDFTWLGLEATQAIQDLNNSVPLVQGKPTLVRGYARTSLAGYPHAIARLHATRTSNGAALPGSPIRSSVASMSVPLDASITDARRKNLASTFNWEIPNSWLNNAVTFTAEINYDGSINEAGFTPPTVPANNRISRNLQVKSVPPICLKLRRTRTDPNTYTGYGAGFNSVINRFRTLTPAREVICYPQSGLFEELSCCTWYPPFGYWSAWEVADDKNRMIAQLIIEATLSTSYTACGVLGANHRVAMVDPTHNTGNSSGFANYVWNVSWVKFDDAPVGGLGPKGGGTLAQEVAHNYNNITGLLPNGRWDHVNCGNPGDGINSSYPYDPKTLGPLSPTAFYGYDPISRQVISPAEGRDYMSYCSPKWTSDYSWKGIMEELGATNVSRGPGPTPGDYLFVIGFIDHHQDAAEVRQVIRIPMGTLPADHLNELLAQQNAATTANPALRIELRGSGGAVLNALNFDQTGLSHEHGDDEPVFAVLIPDNPATTSVLIKRRTDSVTIASKSPSPNPPVISAITSPTSGQTVANFLNAAWTASDPDGDALTFIVQYSRDNGANWEVIASNTPNSSLTLDDITGGMEVLPASATTTAPGSSRLRIIASDGFNTAMRISDPFLVFNRAPIASIMMPAPGARFAAGESIRFRGTGWDPEIGPLDPAVSSFTWRLSLNGPSIFGALSSADETLRDGLPPGSYTLFLTVRDPQTTPGATTVNFTVGDTTAAAPDQDGDGVPDSIDNCPSVANPTQADSDTDGFGDACDNCPLVANAEQGDIDLNNVGNACDVKRLYVNIAAMGANNGLSWTNAFTSLESALAATDTLTTVREIYVAQGRYVPTARTNAAEPRSATFRLRPNVSIYGGFVGNELDAHDLDPRAHPTILSGDLSDNDGPNFANRADNAFSVFHCNSSGVVDGLIISGGNAFPAPTALGGGAHITSSAPTFTRCDFLSNLGGGNSAGAAYSSFVGSPTFRDCRFLGNRVTGSGGAVRIQGNEATFHNCVFIFNGATGAGSRGGAAYISSCKASFVNCTLVSNYCGNPTGGGGGVYCDGNSPLYVTSLTNCIAWLNVDTNGSNTGPLAQVRPVGSASVNVAYSCVSGGYAGPNISTDPLLSDTDGPDNVIGTLDDSPAPMSGSPANDSGSNAYAFALSTDIRALPRIANDLNRIDTGIGGAPIVDMGAYEFQPPESCGADFDGLNGLQVADIFAFLNAWFSGSVSADFDGLNGLQVVDVFAFLNAWFAGC
jgi:hypothetical protein